MNLFGFYGYISFFFGGGGCYGSYGIFLGFFGCEFSNGENMKGKNSNRREERKRRSVLCGSCWIWVGGGCVLCGGCWVWVGAGYYVLCGSCCCYCGLYYFAIEFGFFGSSEIAVMSFLIPTE